MKHLGRLHREAVGSAFELELLIRSAPALPGDQHAAFREERRGELRDGRQAADGPRGYRIVSLAPTRRGAASAHASARVQTTRALAIPADSIALRMNSHLRPIDSIRSTRASGQGNREHQSGEAGPGPDVRDPLRPAQRLDLEPAEGVGDMDPPRLGGIADRGRGRSVGGQEVEHHAHRPARVV